MSTEQIDYVRAINDYVKFTSLLVTGALTAADVAVYLATGHHLTPAELAAITAATTGTGLMISAETIELHPKPPVETGNDEWEVHGE